MLNPAHLARIDLNLLVVFQAVLEEGHVARAAARLNLTPSAVSHGLRRLRDMLRDPLFLRTPKGVVATDRALALAGPISEILDRAQSVLDLAEPFNPATSRRRFVIDAPDAVLATMADPLLRRVAVQAPHVDLGLTHAMPGGGPSKDGPWASSLKKLESREVDVAMLPIEVPPRRFEGRPLYKEDFVVAMRKGHAFGRAPSKTAFCAAQHLLVSLSGEPYGFVDELLARQGRRRRVVLTVPSFMMALAHLPHSDLLAVLPRRLVEHHKQPLGLASTELPFARKPDLIQAVTPKAATMDAGIAWLLSLLTELSSADRRTRPILGPRPRNVETA